MNGRYSLRRRYLRRSSLEHFPRRPLLQHCLTLSVCCTTVALLASPIMFRSEGALGKVVGAGEAPVGAGPAAAEKRTRKKVVAVVYATKGGMGDVGKFAVAQALRAAAAEKADAKSSSSLLPILDLRAIAMSDEKEEASAGAAAGGTGGAAAAATADLGSDGGDGEVLDGLGADVDVTDEALREEVKSSFRRLLQETQKTNLPSGSADDDKDKNEDIDIDNEKRPKEDEKKDDGGLGSGVLARVMKIDVDGPEGDLVEALRGVDAVVACLGNRQPSMARWCTRGATRVLSAMQANKVPRLVILSSMGIGEDYTPLRYRLSPIRFLWNTLLRTLYRSARKDLVEMERRVVEAASSATNATADDDGYRLDYLIVRPVGLTPEEPPVGRWDLLASPEDGMKGGGLGLAVSVAKADVAAFLLSEAVNPTLHNRGVTIGHKRE
mmetsp:Transcript_7891/g.15465  ORF Transcript_7891/g.15465 Transcript_7891/m.15465 type:complete len:438 (-) Transcript_7891:1228-2541(-)